MILNQLYTLKTTLSQPIFFAMRNGVEILFRHHFHIFPKADSSNAIIMTWRYGAMGRF